MGKTQLCAWLDTTLPQVPPTSTTGKALNYLHKEWDELIRYLVDGRLDIDNNRAENAIRPIVLGRKKLDVQRVGQRREGQRQSVALIETVKSNGLESNTYSPVSVHRTAEGRNG